MAAESSGLVGKGGSATPRQWRAGVAAFVVSASAAGAARAGFPQGVACGDVTTDRAVCWTRVEAAGAVLIEIARDESFSELVATELLAADEASGFMVKHDAALPEPGTPYYFRFTEVDSAEQSPVGTFATAPAPDEPAALRFVFSGDSNASHQPFRLLAFAAAEQPDFWFWAGDTAYTDGVAEGLPIATDLAGYRAKHLQNRGDAHLRGLLAEAPVWVQWDDHEVANDYDGGEPEGHIGARRIAEAYQAFFECMPIREQGIAGDERRLYRSFRWGALAEFFILDCRQYRSRDVGRDGGGLDPYAFFLPTFEPLTILRMRDPSRTMLGAEQLAWLKQGLRESTATWKFILSSVPFTSLLVYPFDRWDGYDAERYDLLRYIDVNRIGGVVLLAADIHGNAHNPDVTHYLRTTLLEPFSPGFAVPEFIAGPIATETTRQEIINVAAGLLDAPPQKVEQSPLLGLGQAMLTTRIALHNGLRFIEADRYAYVVVDVTAEGVTLTHRGIRPDPAIDAPVLETLNVVRRPDGVCGAGAWGLWLPFAMMGVRAVSRMS